MLTTFIIFLIVILFLSSVAALANNEKEEFRLKSVSLAIASMVTLFFIFLLL